MPFVFDASVGGVASNSYPTVDEYLVYLETAFEPQESADALDDEQNLVMATRTLNSVMMPHKKLVKGPPPYYVTSPTWTGAPATTTQALPWPRTGMYDRNGNAIASDVIPEDLKNATSELARQLKKGDLTVDNDVSVQGITSVRAGSVALTFKDMIESKVLPDAVWNLMPPSWFTDETVGPAMPALFDVVSR